MLEGKKLNWKKQLFVFFITIIIFGAGFALSNFLAEQRMQEVSGMQNDLRIDILSLETQFSILTQAPCENLNESTLTEELYNISRRLATMGTTLGRDNPEFIRLKKFYSILEIKHWLLLKRAAKDCDLNMASVIYFYKEKSECSKCEDQGYILTYFRKEYPEQLRVYSFDYGLDLSALEALKSTYSLKENLPIIIINDEPFYGFKTKKELENILSEYIEIEKPTTTSTSSTSTEATSTDEGPSGIQP